MKALSVILALLLVIASVSSAQAIALSDSLKYSGLKLSGTHVHVTTVPCKIYTIVVTPSATDGFAQIIETKDASQDNSYSSDGLVGTGFISGQESRILADIRGATAKVTLTVSYPKGVACNRLFLDCHSANAEVYYEQ